MARVKLGTFITLTVACAEGQHRPLKALARYLKKALMPVVADCQYDMDSRVANVVSFPLACLNCKHTSGHNALSTLSLGSSTISVALCFP